MQHSTVTKTRDRTQYRLANMRTASMNRGAYQLYHSSNTNVWSQFDGLVARETSDLYGIYRMLEYKAVPNIWHYLFPTWLFGEETQRFEQM